jgi:hypothetical protein
MWVDLRGVRRLSGRVRLFAAVRAPAAARLFTGLAIRRSFPRQAIRLPLGLGAIESCDGGMEKLVESLRSRVSGSAIRA